MGHALHMDEEQLAKIQARIKASSANVVTVRPHGSVSDDVKQATRAGIAKASKYRNVKVRIDGILFDSKREGARYCELKLLEKAGEISDLELQPGFMCMIGSIRICKYSADFAYKDNAGNRIIEDAKAIRTDVYKLKKKLVKALHGVDIVEV